MSGLVCSWNCRRASNVYQKVSIPILWRSYCHLRFKQCFTRLNRIPLKDCIEVGVYNHVVDILLYQSIKFTVLNTGAFLLFGIISSCSSISSSRFFKPFKLNLNNQHFIFTFVHCIVHPIFSFLSYMLHYIISEETNGVILNSVGSPDIFIERRSVFKLAFTCIYRVS